MAIERPEVRVKPNEYQPRLVEVEAVFTPPLKPDGTPFMIDCNHGGKNLVQEPLGWMWLLAQLRCATTQPPTGSIGLAQAQIRGGRILMECQTGRVKLHSYQPTKAEVEETIQQHKP